LTPRARAGRCSRAAGSSGGAKAFAVHVAALERPGTALDTVRERLAPSGRLYLFSQAPGWRRRGDPERFAGQLRGTLEDAGFTETETLIGELESGFSAGVVARKPSGI
jgi:hypothetical protein